MHITSNSSPFCTLLFYNRTLRLSSGACRVFRNSTMTVIVCLREGKLGLWWTDTHNKGGRRVLDPIVGSPHRPRSHSFPCSAGALLPVRSRRRTHTHTALCVSDPRTHRCQQHTCKERSGTVTPQRSTSSVLSYILYTASVRPAGCKHHVAVH